MPLGLRLQAVMRKGLRSKALQAFRHLPERQDEPFSEKPPQAGDPLHTESSPLDKEATMVAI